MWQKVNRALSLRAVIWLFPIVFLVHDGEELWKLEGWMADRGDGTVNSLSGTWLDGLIAKVAWTAPKFAVAMGILFVLICWACYGVTFGNRKPADRSWFVAALSIAFVNVFTHTAQAIAVGGYTPGVVTAWLVLLPYTAYALYRIYLEGWVGSRLIAGLAVLSVFFVAGGVMAAMVGG